jgi:hypothetical protein
MERRKLTQEDFDNFIKRFSEIRAEASKNQPSIIVLGHPGISEWVEVYKNLPTRLEIFPPLPSPKPPYFGFGMGISRPNGLIITSDLAGMDLDVSNWNDAIENCKLEIREAIINRNIFKKRARWRIKKIKKHG